MFKLWAWFWSIKLNSSLGIVFWIKDVKVVFLHFLDPFYFKYIVDDNYTGFSTLGPSTSQNLSPVCANIIRIPVPESDIGAGSSGFFSFSWIRWLNGFRYLLREPLTESGHYIASNRNDYINFITISFYRNWRRNWLFWKLRCRNYWFITKKFSSKINISSKRLDMT